MNLSNRSIFALILACGLALGTAQAATLTVTTPVDALNPENQPVDSTITLVTLENQIRISVWNDIVDPKSSGQNISAIQFGVSGGIVTGITGSSGTQRYITEPDEWEDNGPVATEWAFDFSDSTVTLSALDGDDAARASHTIVGSPNSSNRYEKANGSIIAKNNGNGKNGHNPFLAGEVTFVLAATGISEQTQITEATVFYGTEAFAAPVEFDVPEVPNSSAVPAPSAVMVGGMLLIGLLGRRSVKARKRFAFDASR